MGNSSGALFMERAASTRKSIERLEKLLQDMAADLQAVSVNCPGFMNAPEVMTLAGEIRQEIKKNKALQEREEKALQGLPPVYADLLRLRYFDGLSYREIASRLHYCEIYARQLNGKALAALEKVI